MQQNRESCLDQRISRRKFLEGLLNCGLGVSIASFVGSSTYFTATVAKAIARKRRDMVQLGDSPIWAPEGFGLDDVVTDANKQVVDFPDKLPGSGDIRKYITPGARYALAHFRQTHEQRKPKQSPEEYNQMCAVQDDIYESITELFNRFMITHLYSEGFIEGLDYMHGLFHENGKRITESVMAAERLCLDGRAVLPCATAEGEERAERAMKKCWGSDMASLSGGEVLQIILDIYDHREDIALKLISKTEDIIGSSLAVVIYGAEHVWGGMKSCGKEYASRLNKTGGRLSFKDNIAVWNLENPDKQFSLIEVTPSSRKA